MKKNTLFIAWVVLFLLFVSDSRTQPPKDPLSEDNTSETVDAITGTSEMTDMTGTWAYSGSVAEFESDNLLMRVGRTAAATMAENKLSEQLNKVGIKEGQMSFTFNASSTFTNTTGKKKLSGTYSYDASIKQVDLKYLKLLNLHAKVSCIPNSMDLLFNSDRLLKLMTFLGSKTNSTALRTVSSLAENYDGMMLGFGLKK